MDEIERVRNVAYTRYEELLMRRDALKKEAFYWDHEYVRVFGDRILRNFELKLECIRKKKTISFCQAAVNYGRTVDQAELQRYLEEAMAAYQSQLEDMIADNKAAKEAQEISEMDLLEIKKIYRRLAKQLHPDMKPEVAKDPALQDLWARISVAYKCNDLKSLQELEILAAAVLKFAGENNVNAIPDIEEKIAEVEAEICSIRNTDPYRYQFILEDPVAVEEKNAALDEEYASYEEYSRQLDEILQELMTRGVTFTWRMN